MWVRFVRFGGRARSHAVVFSPASQFSAINTQEVGRLDFAAAHSDRMLDGFARQRYGFFRYRVWCYSQFALDDGRFQADRAIAGHDQSFNFLRPACIDLLFLPHENPHRRTTRAPIIQRPSKNFLARTKTSFSVSSCVRVRLPSKPHKKTPGLKKYAF